MATNLRAAGAATSAGWFRYGPGARFALPLRVAGLRRAKRAGGDRRHGPLGGHAKSLVDHRSVASHRRYHIVSPCESADMQLPSGRHAVAQLCRKLALGTINWLQVVG
jgi:hypothetical protein